MHLPGTQSLAGRLSWLIVAALLLSQLLLFLIFYQEAEHQYYSIQGQERIQRMVAAMHAVEGQSLRVQEDILDAASDEEFILFIDERSLPESELPEAQWQKQLQRLNTLAKRQGRLIKLTELEDVSGYSAQQIAHDFGEGWEALVLIALPLRDGNWLYATLFDLDPLLLPDLLQELGYFLPILLLIVLVILFSVRQLTKPLARLAEKAERFGRGESFQPLPVHGTKEIQSATQAFNTMGLRLERYVSDRKQMLTAISHDLRSPLTGMRIQTEFIADEPVKQSLITGIEEMQQMIDAILSFSRDEAENEALEALDLPNLLTELSQHYQTQGQAVSYRKTNLNYIIQCRPLSLKRALRNLIENALKYGHCAELSFEPNTDQVLIYIDDQGAGIPEEQLEQVFAPFTQLGAADTRSHEGVGMGLAIARSLLKASGGNIILQNRTDITGLRAIISLPLTTKEI